MKISNFKVRTRLIAGFVLLLLATAIVGVLGVRELGSLHATVERLASDDWYEARDAMSVETGLKSASALLTELLVAEPDGQMGISSQLLELRDSITRKLEEIDKLE